MSSGIRVTVADIRAIHFCSRGSREFAVRHNLNWHDFLKNGVPIEELERFDDEMVKVVIQQAKIRVGVANG